MLWPVQNRKAYYAKVAERRGDAAARRCFDGMEEDRR